MSFSAHAKEELSKINNLAKKDQVKMELIGYLISSNTSVNEKNVRFSTESEYNINRFSKLLKNSGIENFKIDIRGKTFSIDYKISEEIDGMLREEDNFYVKDFQRDELLDKALLRGTFLGGGYVNNPEKKYHLEVNFHNEKNLELVYEILKYYNISSKKIEKQNLYTLYIKEGEEISKFLAFVGANITVLKFEETRVERETNNNLNRLVNCETANFSKTIQAGKKQVEDINYIKARRKFNELPENLQLIANLRLKYPEASLTELVEILDNTISKSGISHRLSAISKFAEELRQ